MSPVDPDRPLLERSADPDPFTLFDTWFAAAAAVVRMPEAMALATTGPSGAPSVRMVLCKGWDRRGFVFYTNDRSRKGIELAVNPVAALLFYWEPVGRQVRIEGAVERVAATDADEYFATRPRGAQLGARASAQSRTVADRAALSRAVSAVEAEFDGSAVPRPPWWGGYRVAAESFEFWQNRQNRLHDRLRYLPTVGGGSDGDVDSGGSGGWRIERLQP